MKKIIVYELISGESYLEILNTQEISLACNIMRIGAFEKLSRCIRYVCFSKIYLKPVLALI